MHKGAKNAGLWCAAPLNLTIDGQANILSAGTGITFPAPCRTAFAILARKKRKLSSANTPASF